MIPMTSGTDNGVDTAGGSSAQGVGPAPGLASVPHQQQPWPPAHSLINIPPPTPQRIPPLKPNHDIPLPSIATSLHIAQSSSLPGPSIFDGRGGGFTPVEVQPQTPAALPPPPVQQQGPLYQDPGQVPPMLLSSRNTLLNKLQNSTRLTPTFSRYTVSSHSSSSRLCSLPTMGCVTPGLRNPRCTTHVTIINSSLSTTTAYATSI